MLSPTPCRHLDVVAELTEQLNPGAALHSGGVQLKCAACMCAARPDCNRQRPPEQPRPPLLVPCTPPTCRLQLLSMLERNAVALCGDVPEPLVRGLYEAVRDRIAAAADGPEGASRLQLAALQALTGLLVKLEMPQRDARLVKVHVETLFRILERSGVHAAAPPELCRCAATCLRWDPA